MSQQKISFICDRQNCTVNEECENCILNLVRYHLGQIDKNTPEYQHEEQILTRLKQVFDHLGVIVVTSQGKVQFITKRGKDLVRLYFAETISASLPKTLNYWFQKQILTLKSNQLVSLRNLPLHIEKANQELRVHLIGDLIKDQYLLLLDEQPIPSFSISSLQLIGLTKREAEVLYWVAQDKNNEAIAQKLDCSKGTVRKHLEHIHHKLGVQSRTAAVIVALEKLGLVNSSFVTTSS